MRSIIINNQFLEMNGDQKLPLDEAPFFPPYLKKKIKEGGFTQKQITERLGMSESWLSKIVNGHRGVDADYLYKIAAILGISVRELFPEGQEIPQPIPPDYSDQEIVDQLDKLLPRKVIDLLIKKRSEEIKS